MKLSIDSYRNSIDSSRNEAVEILNKFGAQKLGQVLQENLAEVVVVAKRALAEG
ncbi:MAG: hypothetical protein ACR5LF_05130 [Symbiopectobacterium sp.]